MKSSRTYLLVVVAWLVVVASVLVAFPRGEEVRPARRTQSDQASRPPQQDEPWAPPKSRLPEAVIDAAQELFAQGFADPRECEYREVELPGESETFRQEITPPPATHAWVIPSEVVDGPRFAVAWNGLVYPVKAVGPAADLEADVRALVKPPDARAVRERGIGGFDLRDPWNGVYPRMAEDVRTARQQGLTAAKVVLLLRLGRSDLAEALWQAGTGLTLEQSKQDTTSKGLAYLHLASAWAWALYHRAATAHARADDGLALASVRELARIQRLIESRCVAWNAPRRPGEDLFSTRDRPYLDFLRDLPVFLADQERRAREPKRVPALKSAFPNPTARIAALIRDFDQVAQEPFFFGRPSVAKDAVGEAVIKEGEAAVEPLLECLEHDDRLTRTINWDVRHRSRSFHIQGVDEAAYDTLSAILGTREFGPNVRFYGGTRTDHAQRTTVAGEIRALWEKTRGLGREERFFQVLADDTATSGQWLDAAEALVQPANVQGRGGRYWVAARSGGKVSPARGERLRGRMNPSLTELMARRAIEIDPEGAPVEPHTNGVTPSWEADRMAMLLAAWDLKGALPALKVRVARRGDVAQLTLLRVKGGDASALDDYAAWVRTFDRPGHGFFATEVFEPLWRYPDHPAIAAVAVALFDAPGSRWVPLFGPGDPGWAFGSEMITSPLLGVAAFRKRVLAGLADDRLAGSVQCDAAGKVSIAFDGGGTISPRLLADEPHRPCAGALDDDPDARPLCREAPGG